MSVSRNNNEKLKITIENIYSRGIEASERMNEWNKTTTKRIKKKIENRVRDRTGTIIVSFNYDNIKH